VGVTDQETVLLTEADRMVRAPNSPHTPTEPSPETPPAPSRLPLYLLIAALSLAIGVVLYWLVRSGAG
jgi:hypothetical protein